MFFVLLYDWLSFLDYHRGTYSTHPSADLLLFATMQQADLLFFKQTSAELRFFRQCRQCFQSGENGAEWKIVQSQWHHSAYTPPPLSYSKTKFRFFKLRNWRPGSLKFRLRTTMNIWNCFWASSVFLSWKIFSAKSCFVSARPILTRLTFPLFTAEHFFLLLWRRLFSIWLLRQEVGRGLETASHCFH